MPETWEPTLTMISPSLPRSNWSGQANDSIKLQLEIWISFSKVIILVQTNFLSQGTTVSKRPSCVYSRLCAVCFLFRSQHVSLKTQIWLCLLHFKFFNIFYPSSNKIYKSSTWLITPCIIWSLCSSHIKLLSVFTSLQDVSSVSVLFSVVSSTPRQCLAHMCLINIYWTCNRMNRFWRLSPLCQKSRWAYYNCFSYK